MRRLLHVVDTYLALPAAQRRVVRSGAAALGAIARETFAGVERSTLAWSEPVEGPARAAPESVEVRGDAVVDAAGRVVVVL